MVKVWAIIGGKDARKSSTVKALTGSFGTKRRWAMEYEDKGSITTFIYGQSPQEIGCSPEAFIEQVHKAEVERVILSLRDQPVKKFPGAQKYLDEFLIAGWKVQGCAYLGKMNVSNLKVKPLIYIPDAPVSPCNATAAILRAEWGIK